MVRTRKNKADQWMPPRVYRGRSAFEWHPKNGGNIRLCPLDSSNTIVWRAYEDAVTELRQAFDMSKLAAMYFAGADFKTKKPRTQKDYLGYWDKIRPVFGTTAPEAIKPQHVRKYMDLRGEKAPVQANREKALLHNIMAFGFERGLVTVNPCVGVKPFKEKPRTRYVTDTEYQAVYQLASVSVRVAMEISYLCAARQGDVLALTRQQITDAGLFIEQGKTGKKQIKEWSPRLRAAVNLGLSQPSQIESMFIIHTRHGTRYTDYGFRANWKRAMQKALDEKVITEKFTFHDLKAKAISDFDGNKQEFSGHKTAAMVENYNRKVQTVPTIGSKA